MPSPGSFLNIAGERYGRLAAIRRTRQGPRRESYWLCRCDCGNEIEISLSNLRTGNSASCGCLRSEITTATSTTHGHRVGNTPEYESWSAMLARVRAKSGRRFEDYGARGITVCERWLLFENFLADMGTRPPGTSIDRINNDGNYEPGNCRWATASEQLANQRRSRKYTNVHPELEESHDNNNSSAAAP